MILNFNEWLKLNEGSIKVDANNLNDIVIKAFKKYENLNYSFKNKYYNMFMNDEDFNKNLFTYDIPKNVDYESENFNINNYPLVKRSDDILNKFYIKLINVIINDIIYDNISFYEYKRILGYDDSEKSKNDIKFILKMFRMDIYNYYINFLQNIIDEINEYIKPDFSKLNINYGEYEEKILKDKFSINVGYIINHKHSDLSAYYSKKNNEIIFNIYTILNTLFSENVKYEYKSENYNLDLLNEEFNNHYKNILMNLIQELLTHEFTHYLQYMSIDVDISTKNVKGKSHSKDNILNYYNNHLEMGATITYFYNLIKSYKNNADFNKLFNSKDIYNLIKKLDINIKNRFIYEDNLKRYNKLTDKNKKRFWKYLYDLLYNK